MKTALGLTLEFWWQRTNGGPKDRKREMSSKQVRKWERIKYQRSTLSFSQKRSKTLSGREWWEKTFSVKCLRRFSGPSLPPGLRCIQGTTVTVMPVAAPLSLELLEGLSLPILKEVRKNSTPTWKRILWIIQNHNLDKLWLGFKIYQLIFVNQHICFGSIFLYLNTNA